MRDNASTADNGAQLRPIIKKKKVINGGGHHGGAWKVAYADFVTAMMAFFLLMWLLNATTEDQRKGIADYFDPSVPVSRTSAGGDSMFKGSSVFSEEHLTQNGRGGLGSDEPGEHKARKDTGKEDQEPQTQKKSEAEASEAVQGPQSNKGQTEAVAEAQAAAQTAALVNLKREIIDAIQNADSTGELLRHLWMEISDAGLTIEIVDMEGEPLFATGEATPSTKMRALLQVVGSSVKLVSNQIEIAGHTDARPFGPGSTYTNWELSADRAQSARRVFEAAGVTSTRFVSIAGRADSDPALDDRFASQNRRIEITLLR